MRITIDEIMNQEMLTRDLLILQETCHHTFPLPSMVPVPPPVTVRFWTQVNTIQTRRFFGSQSNLFGEATSVP